MATPPEIDQHYRNYLQARYNHVGNGFFARTARYLFLWIGVVIGSSSFTDLLTIPTWDFAWTLVGAVVIGLTCIWPILQLRERSMRTAYASQQSAVSGTIFSSILRPFSGPLTKRILIWYAAISVISTATFASLWEVRHHNMDLGPLHSTILSPYQLNERLLFLLAGNLTFSGLLGLWDIYSGRWNQPQWALDGETRGMRFERDVKKVVSTVTSLASLCGVVYTLSWLSMRVTFSRWIIQLSGGLLSPFIGRFAHFQFSHLDLTLPLRLIALMIITALILRVPKVFFDVNATQPFDFSPLTSKMKGTDAEKYLISALNTNDDYLLNFTALEWTERSHQASRRRALLEDISVKPTPWTLLWSNLINQLNRSYNTLSSRGGRLTSTPATAPVQIPAYIPSLGVQQRDTPTLIGQGPKGTLANISVVAEQAEVVVTGANKLVQTGWGFAKPSLSQLVRRTKGTIEPIKQDLVQTNSTAKAVADGAGRVVATANELNSTIQSIPQKAKEANEKAHEKAKQTIESKVWWNAQWNALKVKVAEKGVVGRGFVNLGEGVEKGLARRWVGGEVEGCLPRRMVDLNFIKTLTAFIAGSYNEDAYGQVQTNVPSTIQTFAALHSSLLNFRGETMAAAEKTGSAIWVEVVEEVMRREVDPLKIAIEDSAKMIKGTFGKSMKAFELSPGISQWMEAVCQKQDEQ